MGARIQGFAILLAAVAVTATLVGALLPGTGVASQNRVGTSATAASGASLALPPAVVPQATPPPVNVVSTLALVNESLLPGNFLPKNGVGPYTDAYDPAQSEVFVADDVSGTVSVVSTTTDQVVGTVPVGELPLFVAYGAGTGDVFVGNYLSESVSVINDTNLSVVSTFSVGGYPTGLAYDSGTRELFVSVNRPVCPINCPGEEEVISVSNDAVAANIPVGQYPYGVTYDNLSGEVFVINYGSDNVSVISDSNNTVLTSVGVGSGPVCGALDPGSQEFLVANEDSNTTSVISTLTDTLVTTVAVGYSPGGVTDDSADSDVYVANYYDQNVSVISTLTNSVVATISAGEYPWGGAYDPTLREVLLVNTGSSNVSVISTSDRSVVASVLLGAAPVGVAFDTGTDQLFVTAATNVTVISGATERVVASVPIPGNPEGIAYDGSAGKLFVADTYANTVSVIDDANDSVVATIPVGASPTGVAYDSGTGEVFVTNYGSNNVSVISASSDSVQTTISVGSWPTGVVYDGGRGTVFVANSASSSVSVISDGTDAVVNTISLGAAGPEGLAYDPTTGQIFVADESSGAVTVLSDSSYVVAATIPLGTLLTRPSPFGVAYDSALREVLVTVVDRNDVVSISPSTDKVLGILAVGDSPEGIGVGPASGLAFVANNLQGTISFVAPEYPVTFDAVGLPSGSPWSVTAGLAPVRGSNTTAGLSGRIVFDEPTGDLPYAISAPAGYGVARVTGPMEPSQSSATISGVTTLRVVFGALETLTFDENGLATGVRWGVEVTSALRYGGPPGQALNTTGPSLTFTLVTGEWKFAVVPKPSVYGAVPARGVVVVGPHPLTREIRFHLITEPVVFEEHGLRAGTVWGVNVTGPENLSLTARAGAVVRFLLENGTYSFSTRNVSGETPTPSFGSFTVAAPLRPPAQVITFSATTGPVPYDLGMTVVSSAGSGSNWYVYLALSPTGGLSTGMFGLEVLSGSEMVQPTVDPAPAGCSAGGALSECVSDGAGWYGVLVAANGTISAVYGGATAGWGGFYPGVTSIALTGAYTLVVVSNSLYDGNGYRLNAYSTGVASVSGTVEL
jgi:YVTN family beta-propeller protein